MAKFRVHVFEEVRSSYEVDAESKEAAMQSVMDNLQQLEPIESERTGDMSDDVCVDPLLADGSVDYVNYQWFKLKEQK